MREIAAKDTPLDVKGVLHQLHAYCFDMDLKAIVTSNSTLLDIHSTAEELEATLETVYAPFQVCHDGPDVFCKSPGMLAQKPTQHFHCKCSLLQLFCGYIGGECS